ncbi:MAG: hypothetical protein AAF927_22110 [Bacteroidota bacterium]
MKTFGLLGALLCIAPSTIMGQGSKPSISFGNKIAKYNKAFQIVNLLVGEIKPVEIQF